MKRKSLFGTFFIFALFMLVSCTVTGITRGTKTAPRQPSFWQSSTPEQQGMDSATLAQLLQYIQEQGKAIHSLLIIRNGYIVLEAYYPPYTRDEKHILNSCTKSFVSALAGIAIDRGFIPNENTPMLDFFPERRSSSNGPLKNKITLKHLLTMSSGIDWPQYGSDNVNDRMTRSWDWMQFIFDRPMIVEPGTQFNYSNADSHLVSAVIQKTTGKTAFDFGWETLFQPLGISDMEWDYDPKGISIGSATIYLTPRDMAKLGYLYLNNGQWQGKSLVPANWVRASLTSQMKKVLPDQDADYGYFWWIYPKLGMVEAWGGAGQRIAIFSDLNIVTVMTSDISDDAPVTPFSFEIYRDIRQAVKSSAALPENPDAASELASQITRAAQNQKQDSLPLVGLIGGVAVILIAGAVIWRRQRNKSRHNGQQT